MANNKIYVDYHDKEWGKAIYDDKKLFELLILEIFLITLRTVAPLTSILSFSIIITPNMLFVPKDQFLY